MNPANLQKEEVIAMPDRELVLKIRDLEYEVVYPNSGKFIDIQTRKLQYSSNTYADLQNIGSVESMRTQIMIDAVATFEVLIGDNKLKKDLTIKNLFELDMVQMQALIEAYIKQFLPWHTNWMKYLNQLKSNEEAEQ